MNKIRPTEPRKRPLQARSAATVDAILQATAHILEHRGLSALNTNQIAEKAGVSVGSLYQYFPAKEAILTEIIRRKRQRLLDGLRGALAQKGNEEFPTTLRKLIVAAIEHQLEWPRLARALEYAEAFLPLELETAELNLAIGKEVGEFLLLHGVEDVEIATQDMVALARGMIEAAGLEGETDRKYLADRVCRACGGYLLSKNDLHFQQGSD